MDKEKVFTNTTAINSDGQNPLYHGKEAVFRKMAFASGDIVYNLPWMLVSSFVAFFLTDVALIPAVTVSAILLGSRVWDAINDPMIGYFADKTNTKMGRYRPWLLASSFPFLISVILLFWSHPQWPEKSRIIYTVVVYLLTVIFSTSWNIPYGGMLATLTPDPNERASFASYKILFSSVTCAISSSIFIPLTMKFGGADGNESRGYLIATIIICAIAIPFIFTSFFGTKEVVKPPVGQKLKIKNIFSAIFKNPPLLIVIFSFFIYGFIAYGRMTAAVYFFQYNLGRMDLFPVYALFNGILAGVMAFFGAYLLKIFRTKRNTIIVGYALTAIVCLLTWIINPQTASPNTYMALLLLSGLFSGISASMIFSMIPDTVEYSQWKTGVRTDALTYAGTSFMLKLGGAVAPTLLVAWIGLAGYVPGAEVQTAGSLSAINAVMNLLPAILSVLGIIIFIFYKLDGKMHTQIVQDLRNRGEYNVEQ